MTAAGEWTASSASTEGTCGGVGTEVGALDMVAAAAGTETTSGTVTGTLATGGRTTGCCTGAGAAACAGG